MSVVYYVPTDDDELLVSTMADRSKVLAVARDPKVSLCVLDERWPFAYLQVYADAMVDNDPELVVDVMMAVGERMSGEPLGDDARPFVEDMAERERRVVMRCRPYATFALPPPPPQRPSRAAHALGLRQRPVGRGGSLTLTPPRRRRGRGPPASGRGSGQGWWRARCAGPRSRRATARRRTGRDGPAPHRRRRSRDAEPCAAGSKRSPSR